MNVGEVEIELDGKSETLRPSLGAAKRVNAAGGFNPAINRLLSYDLDCFVTVIAAGLNKKPQDIEDTVYKTGLYNLVAPVVKYVGILANGGKPIEEPTGESKTGEA